MKIPNQTTKIGALAVAVMALIASIWTIGRGGQIGRTPSQHKLKQTTVATVELSGGQTLRLSIPNRQLTNQGGNRDALIRLFEAQTGEVGLEHGEFIGSESNEVAVGRDLGSGLEQVEPVLQVSLSERSVRNISDVVTVSLEIVDGRTGRTIPTLAISAEPTSIPD